MFGKMLSIAIALVIIALAFVHANVAKAQLVEEGMVSYWSFDENTIDGDTVRDICGENHGTNHGAQAVDGKMYGALEFDGDDYVSLTPMDCLVDHSFTIQAWIKISKQGVFNMVLGQGDAETGNRLLHWGIDNAGNRASFCFFWDDVPWVPGDEGLSLDEWYHFAGVYDKAITTARVYLDGVELSNKQDCAGLKADADNSALEIGAHNGKVNRSCFFHGIIDEVGIYDRALDELEIEQNFASRIGGAVNPADKLAETWGRIKTFK